MRHSTPEESENGGFHSEKAANVFHSNYAGGIKKGNYHRPFWICVCFQNVTYPHYNATQRFQMLQDSRPNNRNNAGFSNSSGVASLWTAPNDEMRLLAVEHKTWNITKIRISLAFASSKPVLVAPGASDTPPRELALRLGSLRSYSNRLLLKPRKILNDSFYFSSNAISISHLPPFFFSFTA